MTKALVLLSGGIDSSTCFAIATQQFDEVDGLSIDYGQRHKKEITSAIQICKHYTASHIERQIVLPKTMLTGHEEVIPSVSYDELPEGVSPTYVPFRNGTMLSHVTAVAQAENYDAIFFGAHAEDAANWAYPDCTPEFIGAMANAIYIGTYHKVRLHTPLQWLVKKEIIELGYELRVPYRLTWSCYKGEELHCGICPTCRSRRDGFKAANVIDPTEYNQHPDDLEVDVDMHSIPGSTTAIDGATS